MIPMSQLIKISANETPTVMPIVEAGERPAVFRRWNGA